MQRMPDRWGHFFFFLPNHRYFPPLAVSPSLHHCPSCNSEDDIKISKQTNSTLVYHIISHHQKLLKAYLEKKKLGNDYSNAQRISNKFGRTFANQNKTSLAIPYLDLVEKRDSRSDCRRPKKNDNTDIRQCLDLHTLQSECQRVEFREWI